MPRQHNFRNLDYRASPQSGGLHLESGARIPVTSFSVQNNLRSVRGRAEGANSQKTVGYVQQTKREIIEFTLFLAAPMTANGSDAKPSLFPPQTWSIML